jgi:hypothetical protein
MSNEPKLPIKQSFRFRVRKMVTYEYTTNDTYPITFEEALERAQKVPLWEWTEFSGPVTDMEVVQIDKHWELVPPPDSET